MSKYLDSLGIKSVVGITKWFREQLIKQLHEKSYNEKWCNTVSNNIECVKIDNGVVIFWAVGNKLHKHVMKCSVIYVLQEEDLVNALKVIKESLDGSVG